MLYERQSPLAALVILTEFPFRADPPSSSLFNPGPLNFGYQLAGTSGSSIPGGFKNVAYVPLVISEVRAASVALPATIVAGFRGALQDQAYRDSRSACCFAVGVRGARREP